MPILSPNTDVACPICFKVYPTANHAFTLTCAEQGCRLNICFDCISKAVFNGVDEPRCPHCRRTVHGYSYADFTVKRKLDHVHDQLDSGDKALKDEKHSHFLCRARLEAVQHENKAYERQSSESARKIRRVEELLRTAEENTLEGERFKVDAESKAHRLLLKTEEWEQWAHEMNRVFTTMPLRWAERGMEH